MVGGFESVNWNIRPLGGVALASLFTSLSGPGRNILVGAGWGGGSHHAREHCASFSAVGPLPSSVLRLDCIRIRWTFHRRVSGRAVSSGFCCAASCAKPSAFVCQVSGNSLIFALLSVHAQLVLVIEHEPMMGLPRDERAVSVLGHGGLSRPGPRVDLVGNGRSSLECVPSVVSRVKLLRADFLLVCAVLPVQSR